MICPNCKHEDTHTRGFGCFHIYQNGDYCQCMLTREQILEARVKELEALLMPCGHPLSAAVHSDEVTGYCGMCESES